MPFAGYKDFADCVSQNQDKRDPAAFCSFLHHKVTGKWPAEGKRLSEREKELIALNLNKKDFFKLLTLSGEYSISKESDSKREFSGWGSLEVVDQEGDLITMHGIRQAFPNYMERGGHIMDSHTNRIVGEVMKYDFREEGGVEGLWIKARIYDKYSADDEVWEAIKNNTYKGISLGGKAKDVELAQKDGELVHVVHQPEIYEFSVVREPCNPGAQIDDINYLAKMDSKEKLGSFIKTFNEMGEEEKNRFITKLLEEANMKKKKKEEKKKQEETPDEEPKEVTEDEVEEAVEETVEEAVKDEASVIAEKVAEAIVPTLNEISAGIKKLGKQDEDEDEEEEDKEEEEEEEEDLDKKVGDAIKKALPNVLKKMGLSKSMTPRSDVAEGKKVSKQTTEKNKLLFKEGELGKMNARELERTLEKELRGET